MRLPWDSHTMSFSRSDPCDTLWTPNSPDLNLVDCEVCGIMMQHVYRMLILDAVDLKQCLTAAWSGLQQHVIDKAID